MSDHTFCIVLVTHTLNDWILRNHARLRKEAPADHDVVLLLSSDAAASPAAAALGAGIVQITRDELFSLPCPAKLDRETFEMAGNLDLVFLAFHRRLPRYRHVWFVEYDVHWEGDWCVFFEHFRASASGLLAATVQDMDEVPHKVAALSYPPLVMPEGTGVEPKHLLKAFLPICRLSATLLDALAAAYAKGLCGHYEIVVPSIAAQSGEGIEDFGGDGRYVKPENRNRFYFAYGASTTHSPGSFVFRPQPRVLSRRNTLWHPVKPGDVPLWHPMHEAGALPKRLEQSLKPLVWQAIVWLWFKLRWRPLVAARPDR